MTSLRALSALAVAAWIVAAPLGRAQEAGAEDLLGRHLRAMRTVTEVFAAHPVRIEYVEGSLDSGQRISFLWEGSRFRQEFNWLGFREVFAYDGGDYWYGSDLSLPYSLQRDAGPDVTTQLVAGFAYADPEQLQFLGTPESIPLGLSQRFATMRYAPPGMSEVLLLLDPSDFRLAGVLQGTERSLIDSPWYKLTTFEEWADFGPCWYPTVVRTVTSGTDGTPLNERFVTTQSVALVSQPAASQFARASSPPVPLPDLPRVPFEIPFSFRKDTVVVTCQDATGELIKLELDTGANVGLLRGDEAERLGLTPVGDERVTGHGGAAAVGYVRVEGFKLKGVKRDDFVELPPFPAAVLTDKERLDESLQRNRVSGLLGTSLLSSFVVRLDFRRQRLYLYPPGQFDPEVHLEPGYHAIPCHRGAMPYVDVVVDGTIRGGAFFNTGAQQFFTLAAWAIDAAGTKYEVESVGKGVTVHGDTVFGIIRPSEVRLGEITISRPATHVEMLAPGEAHNPHRIASFGNAFFARYTVTFDLFREVYYIEGI